MNEPAQAASIEHGLPKGAETASTFSTSLETNPPQPQVEVRPQLSNEQQEADEARRIQELTSQVRQAQERTEEPVNFAQSLEKRAEVLNKQATGLRAEHEPVDKGPSVSPATHFLLEAEERRAAHLAALVGVDATEPVKQEKQVPPPTQDRGEAAPSTPTNLEDKARALEAQFESGGGQKAA
ncbi:MAG: hypothetical protein Q8P13_02080 [bacterium]|nr:hypothetical protein [bacterium]